MFVNKIALAEQILEHFEFFNYLERIKSYGNFSIGILAILGKNRHIVS